MSSKSLQNEEEKYRKMWEVDSYRAVSPGLAVQEIFLSYFEEEIALGDSLIDYGAGTGLTAAGFLNHGLDVSLIDIAPNSLNQEVLVLMVLCSNNLRFIQAPLWDLPTTVHPSSWAYCCDVLEHIPDEKLDAVLTEISKRTQKGAFFQIFSQPETFGEHIQEDLHPSLHNQTWWAEKLSHYFPLYATLSIIEDVRSAFFCGPGFLYIPK